MTDKSPHIQLRVLVSGPGGTADAHRSFRIMERLMKLLADMEASAIGAAAGSTWGIEELRLGSVATVVTPNHLTDASSSDLMAELAEWTVAGFAEAEARKVLPDHWSTTAIETGVELAKALGMLESDGMRLELLADGQRRREVVVTRRSADNLRAAMQQRRTSIGSLIGKLDSISVHSGNRAGLWLERGDQRVEVRFGNDAVEDVRAAFGKRVEVSGTVTRDGRDRPLSIRLRSIEQLPEQDVPMGTIVGADPELTAGQDAPEHVRRLYDAS